MTTIERTERFGGDWVALFKKLSSGGDFAEVLKANPYKDEKGRFTTKEKAAVGSKETVKWKSGAAQQGRVLNGVPLKEEDNPDFSQSVNRSIEEPPLNVPKGMSVSAGVIMVEPDGWVWLVQPKGMFGGYKNTFPKGTVKAGEDLQETAAREVWEESGLVPKIDGHLIDVQRTTSVARFYVGHRIGGAPWKTDDETYAVKLIDVDGDKIDGDLRNVFGSKTSDHKVLDALRSVKKSNPYHDATGAFTSKDKVAIGRKAVGHLVGVAERTLDPKKEDVVTGFFQPGEFERLSGGLTPTQFASALLKNIKPEDIGSGGFRVLFETSHNGFLMRLAANMVVNGEETGVHMHRQFDCKNKEVDHKVFEIGNQKAQGGGLAKKFLDASLDLYDHMGIESIDVHANQDVGGYAWARMGFVPYAGKWESMRKALADPEGGETRHITDPEVRTQVETLLESKDPRAMGVIAAMKQPVMKKWRLVNAGEYREDGVQPVGKGMLLHSDWQGGLDLTDPERYTILRSYVSGGKHE